MSYMLACEASDIFKAIAPVAGCMMEDIYNSCNPNPIPVLEIHGTNDNVTLWDGDMDNNDCFLEINAGAGGTETCTTRCKRGP